MMTVILNEYPMFSCRLTTGKYYGNELTMMHLECGTQMPDGMSGTDRYQLTIYSDSGDLLWQMVYRDLSVAKDEYVLQQMF